MNKSIITLKPLCADDKEQFILDNQWAFKYGATAAFGVDQIGTDEEIISRKTIEHSMNELGSETYRIMLDDKPVGGMILQINNETHHNFLDILFINPNMHGKDIGYRAWLEAEKLHPETEIWETCTPYFEKRNIHFYVNKCGFHITEFWNEYNSNSNIADSDEYLDDDPDEMFRMIKVVK
ncbi:MAG: GNAT family N-acetyltransferase [Firmicutes bacterium]|nr:GNAT family N-acetyltransferase [Bacillota bacterium]